MKNPATFRRAAAAVGLVSTAGLMLLSTVLAPEFPSGFAERLEAVEAGGTGSAVSAFAFTLAQLPFVAAVLGIGHLLRGRTPILSNLGTTLAVIGAFGHSVYGGVSLVMLEMASDDANLATHAAVLEGVESGPAVAFMAMGLLGTVLGLLLLAVGIWRSRMSPRWVAPALWLFLLVEFAGPALSEWSSHVSTAVYVVVMVALAAVVVRSAESTWRSGGGATTVATGEPVRV
jgi:hypothetical protein